VKSISVPPLFTPRAEGNLSDLPVRNGSARPLGVAFSRPSSGRWVDVTNAEFAADVRALAKGLMAAGIGLGERIAIMSKTRYEWTLTDFAVWTAGAVPVPIYETSSASQVSWIISDAGCAADDDAPKANELPGLGHEGGQCDAGGEQDECCGDGAAEAESLEDGGGEGSDDSI